MTEGAEPLPAVQLATILRALPAAVYVTRADDGRILVMNPRAEAMIGATVEELAALSVTGPDLWADPQQRAEILARLDAEGEVTSSPARLQLLDGRSIDILTSFRPIEIDGDACLVAVAYDISELSQAEAALRRSEQRLRQIAESIDEGFVLASFAPFRVHYASPTYAEITGTTMEEVYADDPGLMSRIEPADQEVVRASLERMRAGLRSDEVEVRLVRAGELRWIRFRWSVVEGEQQPDGVLAAVVEDITERRRADAELRRATAHAQEASEAKSSFLSRVSHELRTPLNVILGFGQLLEADDLAPAQQEAVREIMGAGRHLLHLVDEVLEISRAESGQIEAAVEAVPLEPVLRGVLAGLHATAARQGIVVRQADPCHRTVRGDPGMLAGALRPLIENAIVHNVPGGTVDVACEDRPGDRVRISVTDTGPGLTPEDLERVYVPFERTQGAGGSGLGLTRARHLVEAMGGELGARSVPGRGSRFWIDLDRAQQPGAASRPDGAPSRRRRVLYIEDNESNAELATRALAAVPDLELVVANRGREGLERIAAEAFDLVLLDLHLPDLGGEEILGRIRFDPATTDLPVVVISADASPEVIGRIRSAGADDYLTKPVSIPHLVRVVDRAAGGRPHGPLASEPSPSRPGRSAPMGATVLDAAVLEDLSVLEDLEPGTLAEVVEVFARSGAERIAALDAGLAAGDRPTIAAMAHGLRGSGANLGAARLAEACHDLERRAREDGGGDDLAEPVAAVRDAFAIAVDHLREHVGRPAEPHGGGSAVAAGEEVPHEAEEGGDVDRLGQHPDRPQ